MPQVPGNTISGAGGYGSYPGNLYRDRYDWIIMPGELRHLAASATIGVIARHPVVSVGVAVAHGYWHLLSYAFEHADHDHSSPGGGGPGQSLTSTNPPPSVEEVGKIVTQPQPRAGQQRIGGKRRCPYNFTGGKWHIGGWYKKDRQCVKLAGHGGRHRKPSWMR